MKNHWQTKFWKYCTIIVIIYMSVPTTYMSFSLVWLVLGYHRCENITHYYYIIYFTKDHWYWINTYFLNLNSIEVWTSRHGRLDRQTSVTCHEESGPHLSGEDRVRYVAAYLPDKCPPNCWHMNIMTMLLSLKYLNCFCRVPIQLTNNWPRPRDKQLLGSSFYV